MILIVLPTPCAKQISRLVDFEHGRHCAVGSGTALAWPPRPALGRCTIQMWSCLSTAIPAACPMTHPLGSRFGHDVSTTKRGTAMPRVTAAGGIAVCAAVVEPMQSAAKSGKGREFTDHIRRRAPLRVKIRTLVLAWPNPRA
jgi:hypothetical protein